MWNQTKVKYFSMGQFMEDRVSTAASYVTSGSLVFFGLAVSDLAILVGSILGIATFIVNWTYKHKHLELERKRNKE